MSKLVVKNLPNFLPANSVRKYLAEKLGMAADLIQCRKNPKWNYAVMTFKSEMSTEDLIGRIGGISWKKNVLMAEIDDGKVGHRPARISKDLPAGDRVLNDQVTPLWRIPYEEQLAQKQKAMQEVVDQIELKREGFELDPIKPSPLVTGYRNKCEFSFGFDKEGQSTLGFLLGGFREGTIAVENAKDCLHVPEAMKELANKMQEFVRGCPDLPVFDRAKKVGFWRLMMVREHAGKMMVVLQCQEGFIEVERLEAVMNQVKALMESFNHDNVTVGSFQLQLTSIAFHGMDPKATNKLLLGDEKLIEQLDGLSFEISASSFFQVNKPGTLILYKTIAEMVALHGPETVLLDLCCGTGTIGLMMSPHVSKVIGVELVPEAIEDAKRNATINGISNVEFKCAKVEDVIGEVISSIPATIPISVILDPPRSGVHKSVMKTIRNCERISSLVFVSCNPAACQQNFADLGKEPSRSTTGKPFELDRAVPVDMFPQTAHCELVLRFNRLS